MSGEKEQFISIENAVEVSERKTEKISEDFRDQLVTMEKKVEQKIEKVDRKIDDSKIAIIETLGVFVALFTFISIELQAFKLMNSLREVAGLSLIMLGALLIFIMVLDLILNTQISVYKHKKIPGAMEPALRMARNFTGYEEKIELNLFNPKTWGVGFCLRIFFTLFSILIICIGSYLLSASHENKEKPLMENIIFTEIENIDQHREGDLENKGETITTTTENRN